MAESAHRRENASDGRLERTVATRRRILEAARALLLDGGPEPTAREIAGRASITTRTLFRHFSDMETLYQTLVEEAEHRVMAVRDEPFLEDIDGGDWRDLIEVIIERRSRVYEALLPLYVSHVWARYRATQPATARSRWLSRGRQRLAEILPDHIVQDETLFAAIDAMLGFEYWVGLRRDQRLGVARARAVLERAVVQLTSS